jgi:nicotinamidase-related amidase
MFLPEKAVLLVIDVQSKLADLMHEKDELIRRITRLIRSADILNMPILFTEQAPLKIGTTIPEIAGSFNGRKPVAKDSFSCCGEKEFTRQLKALYRKQVIVAGIEAHVCVLQTVFDLLDQRYEVQVVSDAVSSRAEADKKCAVERMRAWGADVTSSEAVACELLRTSQHEKFKEIINLIK